MATLWILVVIGDSLGEASKVWLLRLGHTHWKRFCLALFWNWASILGRSKQPHGVALGTAGISLQTDEPVRPQILSAPRCCSNWSHRSRNGPVPLSPFQCKSMRYILRILYHWVWGCLHRRRKLFSFIPSRFFGWFSNWIGVRRKTNFICAGAPETWDAKSDKWGLYITLSWGEGGGGLSLQRGEDNSQEGEKSQSLVNKCLPCQLCR